MVADEKEGVALGMSHCGFWSTFDEFISVVASVDRLLLLGSQTVLGFAISFGREMIMDRIVLTIVHFVRELLVLEQLVSNADL